MKRFLWLSLGCICIALAVVGFILPFLPTVPFLLLAAFSFSKTSPKLHAWLVNHKIFGPLISDWKTSGAIRRPAKITASAMSVVAFTISLLLGLPTAILIFQMVVISILTAFIWSRPD